MIHKKEACEVKRVFKKNQIIIAGVGGDDRSGGIFELFRKNIS